MLPTRNIKKILRNYSDDEDDEVEEYNGYIRSTMPDECLCNPQLIICGRCDNKEYVYHNHWLAITCQKCKKNNLNAEFKDICIKNQRDDDICYTKMANISLKDLLKMKEDEIMGVQKRIGEIDNKYFDLVWFARSDPKSYPSALEPYNKVLRKYPKECIALKNDDENWQHGFNSGMLACARLLSAYVHEVDDFFINRYEDITNSEKEFPFLDT